MKRTLKILSSSTLLAFIATLLVVIPVLAYVYAAPFTITEDNGTSYDMLATTVSVDNQWLADNGFIEADALDTRVETLGGLARPHMVVDDRLLAATAVPADSQTNLYYTTGNTDLTSLDIIAGNGGYITTSDDEPIESAENFEYKIDAYYDTSDSNFNYPVKKRLATSMSITNTNEVSGIVYYDEPVELLPLTYGGWNDIDVSEYVPDYATGLVLHLTSEAGAARIVGVRYNGDAETLLRDIYEHGWTCCGIDDDNIFELYLEDSDAHCYMVGFTGEDFTYLAASVDISLGVFLAWTDIDLSVTCPDATGVIIYMENIDGVNPRQWGLRMNGSGDARNVDANQSSCMWGIVGCDGSQVIEGYAENADVDFFLMGYTTGGVNFNLNADDISLGGAGAWTDIDCNGVTSNDTTHLIIEIIGNGADDYGLRRNGATENLYLGLDAHSWAIVECDDAQVIEGEINNIVVDFFIIGYIEGYVDAPYQGRVIAASVSSGEQEIDFSLNSNQYDFSDYDTYTTVAVNMGGGLMPVVLLDEEELTAAAASVTFSGIDTLVSDWDTIAGVTSRHLVVVFNAASPDAVAVRQLRFRINGSSAAVYNNQQLIGQNAAASAVRTTGATYAPLYGITGTTYANAFDGYTILFPAAFLTTNHKSYLAYGGAAEESVTVEAGRIAITDDIDTFLIYPQTGNFATGSTFWLGVVDERYLVEEDYNAGADFLPDFNNIPQDGSDLCVIGYCRSDRADTEDLILQELNADAVAANYFRQYLRSDGAVTSAATNNDNWVASTVADNATANAFGALYISYSQYNEGANDPHALSLSGFHEGTAPNAKVYIFSARRNNITAITRVELLPNGGANFKQGSLFSLYRVPRTVIDRQELTAPAATITFNNIPQGYEALQILVYGRSSDAVPIEDDVQISYNNDVVAANYDTQTLDGAGAVVTAARNAASRFIMKITAAGEGANEFAGGIVTIPNYAKSDRHKHYYSIDGTNENQVVIRSMRWEDTDPITEIDLTLGSGGNFVAGTIVELVGIFPQDVLAIEVDGDLYGIADGNNIDTPDVGTDFEWGRENVLPYANSIEASGAGLEFVNGSANSNLDCGVIHNAEAQTWFSLWFKPSFDYVTGSPDSYLMAKRLDGNNYVTLRIRSATGTLIYEYYSGGVLQFTLVSAETRWDRNTWYHVICSTGQTIAGGAASDGARMRINNGVAITNANATAYPNGGNLYYGYFSVLGTSGFAGELANIAFGTDDLTTAEETALYNGTIPTDSNNIWYADEGTGVNIVDYGTDGNNGTAGVSCTWVGSGGIANGALDRLWYQPNTMIIGTTLPDRATGTGEDGTFTFGTNPAGVTVVLGSMVSSSQPIPGLLTLDETVDVLPEVETSDWFVEPDVTGTLLANPLRPFVTIMSDTTTLTELQSWRLLGTAFVLFVLVLTAWGIRNHLFICGCATGAAIGICIALTIYPLWSLVFVIGSVAGGLVAERSPSI